ncbi:hypothetical protein [Dyella sp.]|nr:hypothetical protein [Dyella sp.]MDR3446553.1 hypothetical protein [Dyella sp.]
MNVRMFCLLMAIAPIGLSEVMAAGASPTTVKEASGLLVDGGGIDDMFVIVRTLDGREIRAYCVARCGDWFADTDPDRTVLKKELVGRKVNLRYTQEASAGRIAGPADDEMLDFVQEVRFLPK